MGTTRRTVLATALALLALSAPAGAAPREEPGIAFADDSDLAPAKDDLATGVPVTVCNTTRAPLTATLVLSGFGVADKRVVSVTPQRLPLRAGACAEVVVASVPGVTLAKPSYAGFLTVASDGGGLARRKLTVPGTVPETTVKAVGAAETIDLRGSLPCCVREGRVRLAGNDIALTYEGDKAPTVANDIRLGTVVHDGTVLTLYSDGEGVAKGDRILVVPVRVDGLAGHGVFKGTLDPKVAGSADKPVAVTVTVSHSLWMPFAVLLAGLALGLLARLASGRWVPRLRWWRTRRSLEGRYAGAVVPDPYGARYARPGQAAVAAYAARSAEAARRYGRSTLLFDPKAEAYTKIEATLTAAVRDAEVLGGSGPDSLAGALGALEARLTSFAAYLAKHFAQSPSPALARRAAGLLDRPAGQEEPTELPVGGAVQVAAKATAAVALMDEWTGWADELRRYRAWVVALSPLVGGADEARLQGVAQRLVEAHFELLDADDRADIERMRTAEELRAVYQTLAHLAGKYGTYVPSDWDTRPNDTVNDLRDKAGLATAASPALDMAAILAAWRATPIAPVLDTAVAALPEAAGVVLVGLLEALVVVTSGGLAFAVAFQGLVEGKAFGSLADYLAVLALGAGAELVVGSLLGAANRWRTPVAAP